MAIETVLRGDVRFEGLCRGQNARFPSRESERAGRIALCDTGEDVVEALDRFLHAGLRPTVRAGGHCYEDFVDNNPNGAILDLSLMGGTAPVEGAPRYRLGSGATLARAYRELHRRSRVTIPGGTCPPVGAGGHITGGGYGLLSRLHGITSDWVSAVDIVTVDDAGKARLRRADKRNDPDLLRACRGAGGGNFGIVTNFYFETLPQAPSEVLRGNVHFGWEGMTEDRFARILYLYSNYWETRGRDRDTWGLFAVFNLSHRSSGHLALGFHYTNPDGTVKDTRVLEEFLAIFEECKPVRELSARPAVPEHHASAGSSSTNVCVADHAMQKENWIDSITPGADRYDSKFRHKYKSSYMKRSFTEREAKCLYRHLTRSLAGADLSRSLVLVDSFGGAVNRKELLAETSAAQRDSVMKLQFFGSWTDAAQDAAQMQWLRDLYADLYATSEAGQRYSGTPFWSDRYEGCYINYPDADMLQHDFWPQLYYGTGELYPFLQRVKRAYDPHNVFHHSMSVRA